MKINLYADDVLSTLQIDGVGTVIRKDDPGNDERHQAIRSVTGNSFYDVLALYQKTTTINDGDMLPVQANTHEVLPCSFRTILFVVDEKVKPFDEIIFSMIDGALQLQLMRFACIMQKPDKRGRHKERVVDVVEAFLEGIKLARKTFPKDMDNFELSIILQYAPEMFEEFDSQLHDYEFDEDNWNIKHIHAEI